jgi:hypothetical protein
MISTSAVSAASSIAIPSKTIVTRRHRASRGAKYRSAKS